MMEIGNAVERNGTVFVYDTKNSLMWSRNGSLHGFTASTVNVKRGNTIHMFDVKGTQTGTRYM
jgi:hypothetical protein